MSHSQFISECALKARTIDLGFVEGQRVEVACGYQGRNLRAGTIVEIADNGLLGVKFDDGGLGGRGVRPERCSSGEVA